MTTPGPVVTVTEALANPAAAAALLAERCPGTTVVSAVRCPVGPVAVITLEFMPPEQLQEHDYPTETVHLVLDSSVRVYPAGDGVAKGRRWSHRNPTRDLCLFYRQDDPALTWLPQDGLEQLVGIAQRHMASEEYARRNDGRWPVEDAPHGEPPRGTHPIRSRAARRAVKTWARPA